MYYQKHQPLLIDEVIKKAPSILTETPCQGLSNRYQPYPTINFIKHIAVQGWYPVQAVEIKVRKTELNGFQKHMIRFEHPDCKLTENEFLQLLVVNSTDGRCSYQMSLGVWRLICSNGAIVGDQFCSSPKIRHMNHTYQDVIDISDQVLEQAPTIAENINTMKEIKLLSDERNALAKSAEQLLDIGEDKMIDPYYNILKTHRYSDTDIQNTLWGTFNIIQENMTKGYIKVKDKESKPWDHGKKLRTIKSIDRDIKLNKALWTLAEEMKKIKLGQN